MDLTTYPQSRCNTALRPLAKLHRGLSRCIASLVLAVLPLAAAAVANSPNTDLIVFGDAASEAAHQLRTGFGPVVAKVAPLPSEPSGSVPSELLQGALGQLARRLLPRTPSGDYYGGEAVFTLKVDPLRENNFTLKLWGGDAAPTSWLLLEVDGREVGARHHMKDETMLQNSSGWLPGRFVYRTVRLPQALTANKTTVTVKLRSVGWMSYYAPPPYDNYQKRMTAPTVALYRAYSHVGAQPDIRGEPQGQAPQLTSGSLPPTADEAAWLDAWKTQTANLVRGRLARAPAATTADDLDLLAQAYKTPWTPAYANPAVPDRLVDAFDAMVAAYSAARSTYFRQKFADHGGNGDWGGYFGQVGKAITLLWPQVQGRLDQTVNYAGELGVMTRRAAWATALRASVDHGRTNRRTIGNQVTDSAQRTYWANAGLLLVDPSRALLETEARRYLYEAYGLAPWMGDDLPGDGPVAQRGKQPYGPNWFMLTSRGTTKEDCLVGGDYGEMGGQAFRLGRLLGDDRLTQQGIKMLRARAALRYPAADDSGMQVSVVANPIGCRNDHQVNRHKVYLANGHETVLVAAAGAAVIGGDLLGYAQQQLNEGQLLALMPPAEIPKLRGSAGWDEVVSVPDAYAAFRAHAATGQTLPMSSGQRDFAWADEENMVVAAKRGEERFFANLYWRGPEAINKLARVFVTSPTTGHLAEVSLDDVSYKDSGRRITLSKWVDATPVPGGFAPPDNPVNANLGLVLPQAARPDLGAIPPTNRDAGRGTAYTLRYGNWLVAINAHPTETYGLKLPEGFGSGQDLVSGTVKFGPVVLAPKTAAVFYLPDVKPPVTGPSGLFKLQARHSGLVLSTSRDNAGDKSTAKQKRYQAEANQHWTLERASNGDYRVRVKASGLVLEAQNKGGLGNASGVVVRPDRGDNLQLWRVTELPGTAYSLCTKTLPTACLTVLDGSTARDAAVVLSPFTGAPHQQWGLTAP